MADVTMSAVSKDSASKSKAKTANGTNPSGLFGAAAFEFPPFEMPKWEVPAALREFAEKGLAQTKDSYEKMKSAAEEATDLLEETYATASKGAADYGLKLIEQSRENTNAAFDFVSALMTTKSMSEAVELTNAHARKQFEALTAQAKDLGALAQKVATEAAEPVKESVGKAFKGFH